MAKRDSRDPELKVRELEMALADKERELLGFRQELAKINQELEKFINQIASELKLATLIQRSLVPTEIPTIPGFEVSTKFVSSSVSGGDYFDIFELEDKMRFGILMANSSGYGMAALFLSVLLKLTTQIEARKGMEPAQVLLHMTKEIQENIKGEERANIFYAVVDRRRYELSFARAGNIPAYMYKYSEDKLVRLDSGDAPIGKNSKGPFKVAQISLEPRDKLIIASEGITKAQNTSGEAFGYERLEEYILKNAQSGCHEVRNEILFQLTKFTDGRDYVQDLSVIVMEAKDRVLKLRKG